MDYFGDKNIDIGQMGVFSLSTTFPAVKDQPIQAIEPERAYQKYDVVQQDTVEGVNKVILSKDKDGMTRLILGYKEGAF